LEEEGKALISSIFAVVAFYLIFTNVELPGIFPLSEIFRLPNYVKFFLGIAFGAITYIFLVEIFKA